MKQVLSYSEARITKLNKYYHIIFFFWSIYKYSMI